MFGTRNFNLIFNLIFMSLQNKTINPKGGNRYQPHDLSHQLKFTSSVGMLLPVYFDLLSPGDKVQINMQMFSRLQNMTSPAFTRLTEHIDFFSVPVNQLWSVFETWFHGVKDFNSSSLILENYPTIPRFAYNIVPNYNSSALNNMFGGDYRGDIQRLFDLLQYGDFSIKQTSQDKVNPLMLCAYQKIYQDFYRLSKREEKDVLSYQLDRYSSTGITTYVNMAKLVQLRFRPWKQDYFTNVEPSPLVTSESIGIWGELNQLPDWLTDAQVHVGGQTSDIGDDYQATTVRSESLEFVEGETNISTDVIRKMFSFEKLMKLTARAGKTVDLQQLAHFGVKFNKYLAGKVMYLGSNHGILQVDSVINQTFDGVGSLGELGGKAQGLVQGKTIKHTCGEAGHEIIMAIYSCVPESEYSSIGLNRIHTYGKSEDFFHPEFDQLGVQPQFAYEADNTTDQVLNGNVLGWTERWRELKQKYDRVSGGLLTNWKNWVTQRVVRNNQLATFYINPNMLDSIMLIPYTDRSLQEDHPTYDWSNPWATDPLIHALHFDSKKLSQMSVKTDKTGI